MHDNQYLVSGGVSVLADSNLSEAMFDERNDRKFRYDSEMLSCLTPSAHPSPYVIHLQGQHYSYADRYPEEQRVFSEKIIMMTSSLKSVKSWLITTTRHT